MHITYHIKQLVGEDGDVDGYIAFCPSMEPVTVFGKTVESATTKIETAMKLYLKQHPELHDELETVEVI